MRVHNNVKRMTTWSYKRFTKTLQQHCTAIFIYSFIIIKKNCLYFVKKQQRENDGFKVRDSQGLAFMKPLCQLK